jgi:transcriptional regulator with XRE-family HTH domain
MQATTLKEKINLSHAKAIRRSRELLKLTRNEVALRLGITRKAIQKYETGRAIIDEEKLEKILKAMELAPTEYEKIRKGKTLLMGRKEKTVFSP